MNIPKRLKILGRPWKVVYKKEIVMDGVQCAGLCDFEKKTIFLLKELPQDLQFEVFLHEFFHAVFFEIGIDFEQVPQWVEHLFIAGISRDMLQNIDMWQDFFLSYE